MKKVKNWQNTRKAILERDGYKCRICCDDPLRLEVHHIDYCRVNNEHSNLVTLCRTCHYALHKERYKPCEHEDWPIPWEKTDPVKHDPFNQDVCW